MTNRSFPNHRMAALALLNEGVPMSRKAGQFLGQIAVDLTPLSEAQSHWLDKLLEKAGLPPLVTGGAQ